MIQEYIIKSSLETNQIVNRINIKFFDQLTYLETEITKSNEI